MTRQSQPLSGWADSNSRLDSINLADPSFWLGDDWEPALSALREHRPISWHEHAESGKGFWSILRYADIAEITRDTKRFLNKFGVRIHHDHEDGFAKVGTNSIIEMDPPEHTDKRRLIATMFTPKAIGLLHESVVTSAKSVVASLAGRDEVEFVEEVASRLPLEVIANLLGVPAIEGERLKELADLTAGDQDPELGGTPEEAAEAALELRAYGIELASELRTNPGDNLLSYLAAAQINGERLTDDEIAGFFTLLIAGGNETTRTAISYGMWGLSLYPEQRGVWMNDPEQLAKTAVGEIIRWATPVRSMGRVLSEDTVFRGIKMHEGEKVALWYPAITRDPAVFPDPNRLDLTRHADSKLQIPFGTGGAHFCLGIHLARLEVRALFEALLTTYPEAMATAPPERVRSLQINGVKRLPVSLRGSGCVESRAMAG